MQKELRSFIKLISEMVSEEIATEEDITKGSDGQLDERRSNRHKTNKKTKKRWHPDNMTDLLATKIVDPLSWKAGIINAMHREHGDVPQAAKDLGVSSRTLYRALKTPELSKVDRKDLGRPPEENSD